MIYVNVSVGIKHRISRTMLKKNYVSEIVPAVKKCMRRKISMMRLPHATRTTRKVNIFIVNIEVKYFFKPEMIVIAI